MGTITNQTLKGQKRPIRGTGLLVISAVILAQLIDKKRAYNSKIENIGAH